MKDITNVVWLITDAHCCAAHEYHSDQTVCQDVSPFWEFVAGPLNAGGVGPKALNPTLDPQMGFFPDPDYVDQSPLDDIHYFGEVNINVATTDSTVRMITTGRNFLHTKTSSAA